MTVKPFQWVVMLKQITQKPLPAAQAGTTSKDGIKAGDIKPTFTRRLSTGYSELDKVFGSSKRYDESQSVIDEEFGLAIGKAYLVCGQGGVGKTTLYTALAIYFIEELNLRVGVAQCEMSEGEFMEFVYNQYNRLGIKPKNLHENLTVFTSTDHREHCARIKELSLDWMVWDSFSRLDGSNTEKGINRIMMDIKAAILDQCNGFIIGHLHDNGKVKGNKKVVDLCDSLFEMKKEPSQPHEHPSEGDGRISFGSKKNRGGPSDMKAWLRMSGGDLSLLTGYEPLPVPIPA